MKTEKKLTAVEWLQENSFIIPKTGLTKQQLIQQAKEKEKQQIIDAHYKDSIKPYSSSEHYYDETYKNE